MHWKPFASCKEVQLWSPTKLKACFTLLISDAFLDMVFQSALLYYAGNSAVLCRYQNLIQNRFGVQFGSFLGNRWVSSAERTGGLKDWQMSDHKKNRVFENCHFMFQSVLLDGTRLVYQCFNCCACSTEYLSVVMSSMGFAPLDGCFPGLEWSCMQCVREVMVFETRHWPLRPLDHGLDQVLSQSEGTTIWECFMEPWPISNYGHWYITLTIKALIHILFVKGGHLVYRDYPSSRHGGNLHLLLSRCKLPQCMEGSLLCNLSIHHCLLVYICLIHDFALVLHHWRRACILRYIIRVADFAIWEPSPNHWSEVYI